MKKGSDWLNYQSGGKRRNSGVSVLDLNKLPANQRKVMHVLLRKAEMTYSELYKAVHATPAADYMSRGDLDAALDKLSERGWLTQMNDQDATYKANFGHKASSRLPKSIWNALDSKAEQSNVTEESDNEDSKK